MSSPVGRSSSARARARSRSSSPVAVAGVGRPAQARDRRGRSSAAPSGSAARAWPGPTSTSSSPVANGSSVPRGRPSRPRGSSRRTRATTSWEVTPGRLGVEDHARRGAMPCLVRQSCAATCARIRSTSSSSGSSVETPAAWRCPPPPSSRAISDTSTRAVRGAQAHLAQAARGRRRAARARAPPPRVPSTERRWSTMPSESVSSAPVSSKSSRVSVRQRDRAVVVALPRCASARASSWRRPKGRSSYRRR